MINQNPCPDIEASDLQILTGLRLRMTEEYKRKIFFPSMFRFIQNYKDKDESLQVAFVELSRLTGYTIGYLKNTYYDLLKTEVETTSRVDENIDPLNDNL